MDFTRKARWVLDGHKAPDPDGSTFAGVVSGESVRIAFTYAALNGLDVLATNIRNAYLQAPSSRKDYIICGPEFGIENIGGWHSSTGHYMEAKAREKTSATTSNHV